jgi:hypothetical protein
MTSQRVPKANLPIDRIGNVVVPVAAAVDGGVRETGLSLRSPRRDANGQVPVASHRAIQECR